MKYDSIVITGHQRTGTHYIAAVICTNFLNTKDYIAHYKNHSLPKTVKNNNIAYIYTWRDFNSVAKSLFNSRKTFGLNNVNNFESFLKSRYCDMWNPIEHAGVNVLDLQGNHRTDNYISHYFKSFKHTPKEWWTLYHKRWDVAAKNISNIIKVNYNDLIKNFNNSMFNLSIKLDSTIKSFKNITDTVGWYV